MAVKLAASAGLVILTKAVDNRYEMLQRRTQYVGRAAVDMVRLFVQPQTLGAAAAGEVTAAAWVDSL